MDKNIDFNPKEQIERWPQGFKVAQCCFNCINAKDSSEVALMWCTKYEFYPYKTDYCPDFKG